MFRWAHPFIVIFALLAGLANGMTGALASNAVHQCDGMVVGMMNMDDCLESMNGDRAGALDCATLTCGLTQTILPPHETVITSTIATCASPLTPRDDHKRCGLSGPPDLRPPIA
ncbi:MAG: hypothetical protein ACR65U_02310 [Methylocystis sp.]